MKSYEKHLGSAVRSCRMEHKLSQGDIERRTGILRAHISRIENGVTTPTLDTLKKITESMGLRLSKFISIMESTYE